MASELTHDPESQTVDLTGLPEPVVQRVKELVREARAAIPNPEPAQNARDVSAEESIARWREMTSSSPALEGVTVDDSRESIYGDDR